MKAEITKVVMNTRTNKGYAKGPNISTIPREFKGLKYNEYGEVYDPGTGDVFDVETPYDGYKRVINRVTKADALNMKPVYARKTEAGTLILE